jgi:hypothetical protein
MRKEKTTTSVSGPKNWADFGWLSGLGQTIKKIVESQLIETQTASFFLF